MPSVIALTQLAGAHPGGNCIPTTDIAALVVVDDAAQQQIVWREIGPAALSEGGRAAPESKEEERGAKA